MVTKTWLTLLTAIIGAAAVIFAAVIGADAKHDREVASAALAAKASQIQDLQGQIQTLQQQLQRECSQYGDIRGQSRGLEGQVATVGKQESTTKATITPKSYTRESNGFRFSFSGSSFRDRKLKLNIIVVSEGQDRRLWISHKTRLIDDMGQVYNPSHTTLGTEEQTFGGMAYDCPANAPVAMTIEFDNINTNAHRFELLEVNHKDFTVKYSGDDLFNQPASSL